MSGNLGHLSLSRSGGSHPMPGRLDWCLLLKGAPSQKHQFFDFFWKFPTQAKASVNMKQ